jgi:hypothetical protein
MPSGLGPARVNNTFSPREGYNQALDFLFLISNLSEVRSDSNFQF